MESKVRGKGIGIRGRKGGRKCPRPNFETRWGIRQHFVVEYGSSFVYFSPFLSFLSLYVSKPFFMNFSVALTMLRRVYANCATLCQAKAYSATKQTHFDDAPGRRNQNQSLHSGANSGHFKTSKIYFPTSEGVKK